MSRRSQEIGIRVALGARHLDVARLVIGRGIAMAGIGLALGGSAAGAAVRGLRSVMPEIVGADPLTFAVAAGLLFTTALCACAVPAMRAMQTDPTEMLRAEG